MRWRNGVNLATSRQASLTVDVGPPSPGAARVLFQQLKISEALKLIAERELAVVGGADSEPFVIGLLIHNNTVAKNTGGWSCPGAVTGQLFHLHGSFQAVFLPLN